MNARRYTMRVVKNEGFSGCGPSVQAGGPRGRRGTQAAVCAVWACVLLVFAAPALAHVRPTPAMYYTAGQPPKLHNCSQCHSGVNHVNPSGRGAFRLEIGKPGNPNHYRTDDGPYLLVFKLDDFFQYQGGIEVVALDGNNRSVGSFYRDPISDWFRFVQIDSDPGDPAMKFVHHNSQGGNQLTTGRVGLRKQWTVQWYPPPFNVGPVTIYAAAVAGTSNGAGTVGNDAVYTLKHTFTFAQPPAKADLDRDETLNWRDIFYFSRQWRAPRPTPSPIVSP